MYIYIPPKTPMLLNEITMYPGGPAKKTTTDYAPETGQATMVAPRLSELDTNIYLAPIFLWKSKFVKHAACIKLSVIFP